MCNNTHTEEASRTKVQQFLSAADRVISNKYPTSSKHYLAAHYHMPIQPVSRIHDLTVTDQDVSTTIPPQVEFTRFNDSMHLSPQALALQAVHKMMTSLCQEMNIQEVHPMTHL